MVLISKCKIPHQSLDFLETKMFNLLRKSSPVGTYRRVPQMISCQSADAKLLPSETVAKTQHRREMWAKNRKLEKYTHGQLLEEFLSIMIFQYDHCCGDTLPIATTDMYFIQLKISTVLMTACKTTKTGKFVSLWEHITELGMFRYHSYELDDIFKQS